LRQWLSKPNGRGLKRSTGDGHDLEHRPNDLRGSEEDFNPVTSAVNSLIYVVHHMGPCSVSVKGQQLADICWPKQGLGSPGGYQSFRDEQSLILLFKSA